MFNDNDRLQQMEDNWNNEIIGYDKGGYYTDTEYVSDDVAVEQGFEPQTMQERADEFRKDDSLPSEPENVWGNVVYNQPSSNNSSSNGGQIMLGDRLKIIGSIAVWMFILIVIVVTIGDVIGLL